VILPEGVIGVRIVPKFKNLGTIRTPLIVGLTYPSKTSQGAEHVRTSRLRLVCGDSYLLNIVTAFCRKAWCLARPIDEICYMAMRCIILNTRPTWALILEKDKQGRPFPISDTKKHKLATWTWWYGMNSKRRLYASYYSYGNQRPMS
jgi:hypothetical protein